MIHRISFGTKNNIFFLNFINKKKNKYVNTTYEINNFFLHLASSFTVLMFNECIQMCKNKK